MKKILVLSSFPAGYRVDVFKGLAKHYELTVLFGAASNENRNPDWFVKNGELRYHLVDTPEGKKVAEECYKNLKKYDLVLGYDWYQNWALKFEVKAWCLGVPYIINCDGAFVGKFNVKDIVKRFFIKNASVCLAGGKYAKRYFEHYGAAPEKIHLHNFTSLHEGDILPSPIDAEEKKQLRKQLDLSEKKMVLSIGQFVYRKGFDILLDAWSKVDVPESQLVIIGGGSLSGEYKRKIKDENISNVTILDFVPFGEIFKYYMAADVFALATREDIWGLIVNESMANGVPVLISDKCIAGLELISEGVNGSIIKDNDAAAWTKKLVEYLSYDKDMQYSIGQKSIELIREHTIEQTVCSDIKAIRAVIGQ